MAGLRFSIFVFPGGGHLTPALNIARAAVSRGHEVTICSVPDVERRACSSGFAFEPILAEMFPRGSMDSLRGRLGIAMLRQHVAALKQVIRSAGGESVCRALTVTRPDIGLVDSALFIIQLQLRAAAVPHVVFHVTLPWNEDGGIPPLNSSARPGCSMPARLGQSVARARRRIRHGMDGMLDPLDMGISLQWRVRQAAADWDLPADQLNLRTHPVHMIAAHEVILCPQEFDFPRPVPANRHYVGPTAQMHPPDDGFPLDRLDGFRTVIYCAWGTHADLYRGASAIERALVDIAVSRDDVHAVIVSEMLPTELGRDSRVTVVRQAPQPLILRRATVFITHAGLGSVKESIMAGVPLIAVPMVNDQFGNAARIEHHSLGRQLCRGGSMVSRLGRTLDAVIRNGPIEAAIKKMQTAFVSAEQNRSAITVIEGLARRATLEFHH